MPSIKILHTADLHLGSAFGALSSEKANMRKTHLWQTLDQMIALAKAEQVDAFLISGDLFDDESAGIHIAKTAFEKLGRLGDIPVFIAAGNHDPADVRSVYQTLPLPPNIHVFSTEEMEQIDLSPDVHIYGRSFGERYESDLLERFRADDGGISIMVLHGDVGNSSDYNPITVSQIAESNLTYLALGHIHQRSDIARSGSTYFAYPGAPEGHGFDECGERGVYLGEISEYGANLRFVPLAKHLYYAFSVDISDCSDEEQIRTKIIEKMGDDRKNHLYKVVLTGLRQADFSLLNLSHSLEEEAFFVKLTNQSRYALSEEQSDFGHLTEFMRSYIKESDAPEEIQNLALYYGQMALSGKEVDVLENYES